MVYGAFSPSVLGMLSQSHALNVIGSNIANATTGGYRAKETRFSSLLGPTVGNESALGGIKPTEFSRIDKQGLLAASKSAYDLGIAGRGFFALSNTFDMSGEILYGRDGSFQMQTVNDIQVTGDDGNMFAARDGYLVDKNGYFVLGWEAAADGTFPETGGELQPLRIDAFAFSQTFVPTTTAELNGNLRAGATPGDVDNYAVSMVDSAGDSQPITFNFTKLTAANQWEISATTSQDPVSQMDTVTLAGTLEVGDIYSVAIDGTTLSYTVDGTEAGIDDVRNALIASINTDPGVSATVTAAAGAAGELTLTANTAGNSFTTIASATDGGVTPDNTATGVTTTANVGATQTTVPETLVFDANGQLVTPQTVNLTLGFAGGTTADIAMDISNMIQLGGDFLPMNFSRDGSAASDMAGFSFDESGRVIGHFEDSTTRVLYKIPMAVFNNPNALEERSGNVYAMTTEAGAAEVVAAGSGGAGIFQPYSHELSNVNIEVEFSAMIMTQHAYNSSATVFRTVDEMIEAARDLKR